MSNSGWGETKEEGLALDLFLQNLEKPAPEENGESGDDWVHLAIAVPSTFAVIFQETVMGYQALTGSDKVFPAFEAMVMEARNSLPSIQEGLN